jgi:hypothetical protein
MKKIYSLLIASVLTTIVSFPVRAASFKWSFSNVTPIAGGKVIFIRRVDGTYRDPVTGIEDRWVSALFNPPLAVPPSQRVTSNVSDSPTGQSPNNYHLIGDDPGLISDFTLAFLVDEGGSFKMLDLGEASQSRGFVGDNEFLVPGLFSDNRDIYVAVDLTQWLNSPMMIPPEEAITLTNGMSDRLPGFLVSTSPIEFDMASGFTTSSPVNDTVYARGVLDGSAAPVPEPSTVLGSGMILGFTALSKKKYSRKQKKAKTLEKQTS